MVQNGKQSHLFDGMYSYDDLDDYITQSIIQNGDKPSSSKGINLYFVLSSYRVVIELDNQWQLDIRTLILEHLLDLNQS